ncbi:MAG: glycoside hydrolase family 10 protein [Burkholderiales bacterium]
MRAWFATISMILLALAMASAATATAQTTPTASAAPLRGVWIPQPAHTDFWRSPEDMKRHIAALHEAGINTICVVVWNQGRTFYKSRTLKELIGIEVDERMAGRDPLAEVVAAARPYNMRIYAWFEFGFATDVNNGPGREIVQRKPHWVARKSDGTPLIRNGFRWLNAFDAEVQDFMLALMMEVVAGYDITGIQGDDRLPACPGEGGYNDSVKTAYAFAHDGVAPPTNHKDLRSYEAELDKIVHRQVPKALHHKVHPGLLLRLADGYAAPIALVSTQVAANTRAGVGGEVYFFNEGVMKNLTAIKAMYGRE